MRADQSVIYKFHPRNSRPLNPPEGDFQRRDLGCPVTLGEGEITPEWGVNPMGDRNPRPLNPLEGEFGGAGYGYRKTLGEGEITLEWGVNPMGNNERCSLNPRPLNPPKGDFDGAGNKRLVPPNRGLSTKSTGGKTIAKHSKGNKYTKHKGTNMKFLMFLLCLTALLFAEVSLSGKVVDATGTPVRGARLMLVDTGLIAYSGADGSFAFAEQIAVMKNDAVEYSVPYNYFFDGQALELTNLPSEKVTLSLFTVSGRELIRQSGLRATAGALSVDLSSHSLSTQLYLLRVEVAGAAFVTKLLPGRGSVQMVRPTASVRASRGDKLVTDKAGFTAVTTDITDLATTGMVITLTASGDKLPAGMKTIPAGSFMMGSDHQLNNPNETPVHEVELSAFYMDSVEVTQAEYKILMGKEPWVKQYEFAMSKEENPFQFETAKEGGLGNKLPAWFLTWYDAVLYCNERSKKEGLDTVYTYDALSGSFGEACTLSNVQINYDVDGYRLPTEAEWEYAYRAGTSTEWYWGTIGNTDTVSLYAWHDESANHDSHPVGTLMPNAFGIYDMSGNVSEFCNDYYDGSYYSKSPLKDPTGPVSGEGIMIKGGWWFSADTELRAARRLNAYQHSNLVSSSNQGLGIRCVRRVR